mgnify:CR=1 FL=1
MKRAWSPDEIATFLMLDAKGIPADGIACGLVHRSKAAVQGMRRKLKRLRELGVTDPSEQLALLAVHEAQYRDLSQIRDRAGKPDVPVKPFLRRNPLSPGVHLVGEHARQKQGGAR